MKGAFKMMPGGRQVCLSTTAGNAEYRRRREEVWDRDRGQCVLCSEFVPLECATTEHIIPKGMGGSKWGGHKHDDRVNNLAVSHWHGNNNRGSMALELYLQKPLDERKRACQPYLNL